MPIIAWKCSWKWAHFVLEGLLYNFIRDRSLFPILECSTRKSQLFLLNGPSRWYLIEASTLRSSRRLTFLTWSWCTLNPISHLNSWIWKSISFHLTTLDIISSITYYFKLRNVVTIYYISHILSTNINWLYGHYRTLPTIIGKKFFKYT